MSMLGDEQNQQVSNGSTAVQVGGNCYVFGMNYKDVKDICTDLFEANFPKLREEAKNISIKHIDSFSEKFFNRLETANQKIENIQERLTSPDVQAAINTSILHVARMADKSHQEILCELLVEKINTEEDEKNLLINQSIDVMSKISKNQILFLIFLYLLREIFPIKIINDIQQEDDDPSRYYNLFENMIPMLIGDDIYKVDQYLLLHNGLIRQGSYYSIPLIDRLSKTTNVDLSAHIQMEDGDVLNKSFPNLTRVIKHFGFDDIKMLDRLPLSLLANEIAIAYLRNKKIL